MRSLAAVRALNVASQDLANTAGGQFDMSDNGPMGRRAGCTSWCRVCRTDAAVYAQQPNVRRVSPNTLVAVIIVGIRVQ